MDVGALAMLVGPVGLLVVGPLAWAALVMLWPPARVLRTAAGVTGVGAAALLTYWYLWGRAFDAADALRAVPPWVAAGSQVAAVVCALACLLLVALVPIVAVAEGRRGSAGTGGTPAGASPGTSA